MSDADDATTLDVTAFTAARHPAAIYQGLLDAGIFALPTCLSCARAHYPPRVLCPNCGAVEHRWCRSTGTGVVYSTSTLTPRDAAAYAVILVDLDDGPRLMSNPIDIEPDEVEIGLRVIARIEVRDGAAVPVFAPDGPRG